MNIDICTIFYLYIFYKNINHIFRTKLVIIFNIARFDSDLNRKKNILTL